MLSPTMIHSYLPITKMTGRGSFSPREFQGQQLQRLLGGMSFEELIGKKPDLAFQPAAGK